MHILCTECHYNIFRGYTISIGGALNIISSYYWYSYCNIRVRELERYLTFYVIQVVVLFVGQIWNYSNKFRIPQSIRYLVEDVYIYVKADDFDNNDSFKSVTRTISKFYKNVCFIYIQLVTICTEKVLIAREQEITFEFRFGKHFNCVIRFHSKYFLLICWVHQKKKSLT